MDTQEVLDSLGRIADELAKILEQIRKSSGGLDSQGNAAPTPVDRPPPQ